MFGVSRTGMNVALREIAEGKTYPDFWKERVDDEEEGVGEGEPVEGGESSLESEVLTSGQPGNGTVKAGGS